MHHRRPRRKRLLFQNKDYQRRLDNQLGRHGRHTNRRIKIAQCSKKPPKGFFLFLHSQIELTILLLHLTAHPLTVRRLASRWVGWCSGSGGSTARRSSASSLAHHPPIPPSLPISHNLTVLSFPSLTVGFLPPTFFYVGAVICLPATPHTAVPATSVWLPAAGHPGLLPRWQLCLHTFPIE